MCAIKGVMKQKKEKKTKVEVEITKEKIDSSLNLLKECIDKRNITLGDKDVDTLKIVYSIVGAYITIVEKFTMGKLTIKRLAKMIFGSNASEKLSSLLNRKKKKPLPEQKTGNSDTDKSEDEGATKDNTKKDNDKDGKPEKPRRKGGNGRHGVDDFTGGKVIHCHLCDGKRPGDPCPECKNGSKLYQIASKISVFLFGSPIVSSIKTVQEQSGHTCGVKYTADLPPEYSYLEDAPKHDATAVAAIVVSKFSLALSYYGLDAFQEKMGVPLPASTQSNLLRRNSPLYKCLFESLYQKAVNRDRMIFDDSGCKILEGNPLLLLPAPTTTQEPSSITNSNDNKNADNKYKKEKYPNDKNPIKGYASVFACQNLNGNDTIALSFFSFNHAGQNLLKILGDRKSDLPKVIALSDALKAYIKYKKNTHDCLCNAHSRRYFVDSYQESEDWISLQVLYCYRDLYKEEAYCQGNKLSPEERLAHHQLKSTAILDRIENLCNFALLSPDDHEQVGAMREKILAPENIFPVEPKTGLGKAANYFLERSSKLRKFLDTPGVPLDTNLAERLEKHFIAIRNRSLFFKTNQSATDAGYIDSLLLTAEINGHNPLEYFSFIHVNKDAAMKDPNSFLPINYKQNPLYLDFKPLFSMALGNRPLEGCHSSTTQELPDNSS